METSTKCFVSKVKYCLFLISNQIYILYRKRLTKLSKFSQPFSYFALKMKFMQYNINFLQEGGALGQSMFPLFMIGILVIFYLFFIRPQTKKQKDEKKFRESLTKGDKVMTIGGIYGKVTKVEEVSVLVQVDDNTNLRLDKTAVKAMPEPAPAKK